MLSFSVLPPPVGAATHSSTNTQARVCRQRVRQKKKRTLFGHAVRLLILLANVVRILRTACRRLQQHTERVCRRRGAANVTPSMQLIFRLVWQPDECDGHDDGHT